MKIVFTIILMVTLMACSSKTPAKDTVSSDSKAHAAQNGQIGSEQESSSKIAKVETEQIKELTEVTREELNKILALGPARVLGMVQTDSAMANDKFIGFRIVSFRTDYDVILGLQAGDVLLKINGFSIERPGHLEKVLEALKKAKEISFKVIRDGETKVLTTPIN